MYGRRWTRLRRASGAHAARGRYAAASALAFMALGLVTTERLRTSRPLKKRAGLKSKRSPLLRSRFSPCIYDSGSRNNRETPDV
ncbi:hypothetical protein NDU88_005429 [Pleurodeles waltl]|uniref:Uncharacterized protein n=1 Tax=Pleurodeles waltl TaxID=8319 RepID=A0AAV7WBU6_PLEWA|nr:hypothetical protein NDU88_005429 [Pleurodeles waltl]